MKPIVHLIAAARPNFMKVAPLYHALKREEWCEPVLVHTGQHYDPELSEVFLSELGLPSPDISLGIGSGTHAEQTGRVMAAYERACIDSRPDWCIVAGDVNSTLACTIASAKLQIPVAHLEAGLRSFDRSMPEELNRVVTDALSSLLWTPSADGTENLLREGVPPERIEMVGNIMIDSYEMMRPRIVAAARSSRHGLADAEYGVVTLHRPANVDDEVMLGIIVRELRAASQRLKLVFPIHPRTRLRLEQTGLLRGLESESGITLLPPIGYVEFMALVEGARLIVTDSGGVQEETTYLGIPCLTVRPNTERPVTVTLGTNRLVAPGELCRAAMAALDSRAPTPRRPPLWDGRTAARVADSLRRNSKIGPRSR